MLENEVERESHRISEARHSRHLWGSQLTSAKAVGRNLPDLFIHTG